MPEPQCLALAPALVPTCASEVTYPVALADGASTAGYLDRLVKGYLDTYTPHLNLTLHAPCVDAMRRLACRVYFPSCEGVGRGQGLVCTDACDELLDCCALRNDHLVFERRGCARFGTLLGALRIGRLALPLAGTRVCALAHGGA